MRREGGHAPRPTGERADHVSFVPESGWPLVCGFVERITYSHCAIRTTLRQLGLSQSLFQEVFAWLPSSSQELVDRGAISLSLSLPARSTGGFRRSAPSTWYVVSLRELLILTAPSGLL